MTEKLIRVGIVGATGYSGRELIRLLLRHERVRLTYLAGRSEGKAGVGTQSRNANHADIISMAGLPIQPYDVHECVENCDFVFVALPSGVSGIIASDLWANGLPVIDLSGDLRLAPDIYSAWYHKTLDIPIDVQKAAVYGLTEQNRAAIGQAQLIANPGCFATCISLSLIPIVKTGAFALGLPVIVDAKSGVSGAGRTPTQNTHFPELMGNFYPYRVGRHQHTPEIEQTLALSSGTVLLTTQLLPINRGIYSISYVHIPNSVSSDDIYACMLEEYESEPFIRVLPTGFVPELKDVIGTNQCAIGLHLHHEQRVLQVFAVLDNLLKGAAGQAVQNMNVMKGWPETTGLEFDLALFP